MMQPLLFPLLTIFDLNTRLYAHCLADVSDDLAGRIVAERVNTMIFLALHCLDARVFMAEVAGSRREHPYPEIAAAERVEEIHSYPCVMELREQWHRTSSLVRDSLETLSTQSLRAPSPRSFPVSDNSVLGALSFLLQHESYHIGQLALLRRVHGLKAMSYADDSSGL